MAEGKTKKEPLILLISKFVSLLCFLVGLILVSGISIFVFTEGARFAGEKIPVV